MRISTISSSFAAVVARVTDSVVVAGIAARHFLHSLMCERGASTGAGYWQTPNQPGLQYPQGSNLSSRLYLELLRLAGIKRLQPCPAPTRLACPPSSHDRG